VLVNPTNNPANVEVELRQAEAAANSLGLQAIHVLQASTEPDLEGVFSTLIQQRAGTRDHRRYIVFWKKRAAGRYGISPANWLGTIHHGLPADSLREKAPLRSGPNFPVLMVHRIVPATLATCKSDGFVLCGERSYRPAAHAHNAP
jgi:hypothetical protein